MKRFFLMMLLGSVFLIVEFGNLIFLALDNVFYPSWKKTRIKAPVFILGMPRTGTTWLQTVLSTDHGQFSSMKLWEILLAPSVIQKKIIGTLAAIDKRMKHALTGWLRKLDKQAFSGYDPIHPTSLFTWGEDDLLLIHKFSGLFLIFLFPGRKKLYEIIRFDELPNDRKKEKIIRFYHKCLQKHMFVFGMNRTYLSKSAGHTPKMRYLSACFPDSRFICTVRSPVRMIPSAISLFVRFCDIYHTSYDMKDLVQRVTTMADYWYPHPIEVFESMPEKRFIVLIYEQFSENIFQAVNSVYRRFGMEMAQEFSLYLEQENKKVFVSRHQYSAEKYGLNSSGLEKRYEDIYQALKKLATDGNQQETTVPFSVVKNG